MLFIFLQVGNELTKYKLHIHGFLGGNSGDSLLGHTGMKFTTIDQDNDIWSGNCAVVSNCGVIPDSKRVESPDNLPFGELSKQILLFSKLPPGKYQLSSEKPNQKYTQ